MKKVELEEKKETLRELRESVVSAVDQFPLLLNPCDVCKFKNRDTKQKVEICKSCCYFYASKFEMEF